MRVIKLHRVDQHYYISHGKYELRRITMQLRKRYILGPILLILSATPAFAADANDDALDISMQMVNERVETQSEVSNTIELPARFRNRYESRMRHAGTSPNGMRPLGDDEHENNRFEHMNDREDHQDSRDEHMDDRDDHADDRDDHIDDRDDQRDEDREDHMEDRDTHTDDRDDQRDDRDDHTTDREDH